MQAIASGMGGYLAGRLRTKWVAVHTDEVFFRDTAHGFLTWAVAVVIAASLLTTAASSLVTGAGTAVLAAGSGLAGAHYRDRSRANPDAYLGAYFVLTTVLRMQMMRRLLRKRAGFSLTGLFHQPTKRI